MENSFDRVAFVRALGGHRDTARLQLKEMTVPDMTMSWTMPASAPCEYELRGDQIAATLTQG